MSNHHSCGRFSDVAGAVRAFSRMLTYWRALPAPHLRPVLAQPEGVVSKAGEVPCAGASVSRETDRKGRVQLKGTCEGLRGECGGRGVGRRRSGRSGGLGRPGGGSH